MNLDKLFSWIIGIVIAFVLAGKLDILQAWIWKAQAKVMYEARTSTWRSPRFFPMASKPPAPTKKNFVLKGSQ